MRRLKGSPLRGSFRVRFLLQTSITKHWSICHWKPTCPCPGGFEIREFLPFRLLKDPQATCQLLTWEDTPCQCRGLIRQSLVSQTTSGNCRWIWALLYCSVLRTDLPSYFLVSGFFDIAVEDLFYFYLFLIFFCIRDISAPLFHMMLKARKVTSHRYIIRHRKHTSLVSVGQGFNPRSFPLDKYPPYCS